MIETSDILFGALDDSLLPPRFILISEPEPLAAVFLDGYSADLGFPAATPDPTPVIDPDATGPTLSFSSFIPASLGLGYLLTTTQRTVTIRNDTEDSWTLTSIIPHDAAGVTVALIFGTLPITLDPGETQLFTVEVVSAGAERLNARIEFVFGVQGTYDFYVSAFRAPVFPFRPNWAETPTERLSWLTDVMLSYNGNETRTSLRERPRRQLEINVAGLLSERQYLDSVIVGMQDRRVLFPLWFERQHILADLPAGSTEIDVSTVDREYAVGGYVVIQYGLHAIEVGVIASMTSGSITLDAPTGQAFPANALISPAYFGTFEANIAGGSPTAGIATARLIIQFMDLPLYTPTEEDNGAYSTFDGKPVALRAPNRADDVTVEYRRLRDTVDFQVGIMEFRSRTEETFNVRSYSFYLRDRADRMRFRKWLSARRGQAVPFLYPVWENNFDVREDITSTDTELLVKNQRFSDLMLLQDTRRYLAIKTTAGAWHYAKISTIDPVDADTESITLTAAFGANLPRANIAIAMFMEYSVLNADSVELAYPTDTTTTVKLAVRSVLA